MHMQKRKFFLFAGLAIVLVLSCGTYVVTAKKISGTRIAATSLAQNESEKEKEEAERVSQSALLAPPDVQAPVDTKEQPVVRVDPEESAVSSEVAAIPVKKSEYPLHKGITATYFWAGEEAGEDNKNISNLPSAWDEEWVKHFGGVDNPKKRNGFFPAGFTPKENPFYFALPYNDFDESGNRKKEVYSLVGWAKSGSWKGEQSLLKNQWIKIIKGNKVSYAQWQDVGPFKEDDAAYVFGNVPPKSKTNHNAGLDVSPAVRDMLGLADIDTVDWQFIDAASVPDGPWKKIVTTSQVYWK
jgi:hypothetical protein